MSEEPQPVLVLDTNVLITALLNPHGPPAAILADGVSVAPVPLRVRLPDPDDEPFLEAAIAAGPATVLVTGNLGHFPAQARQGVQVLTPREWLDRWRNESQHGPACR